MKRPHGPRGRVGEGAPGDASGEADGGPPPGAVRLGRLGRSVGLTGALRCQAAGEAEAAALLAAASLWVAGHGALAVRQARPHGRWIVVAFRGVRTPERARTLVNADVYAEAPEVGDELASRAVDRLEGAEVRVDGVPYGRVTHVRSRPRPLLVVSGPDGERWLPLDAPYVRVDGGVVEVDGAPDGLLDG